MKPPAAQHYLVIDQGGHGTRALVYHRQGDRVLSAQAPLDTHSPQPGWFEQGARDLEQSVRACLQQLETQLRDHPLPLHSAVLVTQRSSLLACDRHTLRPLTPVISWQDTRNAPWLQQKIDRGDVDPVALRQLTGLRPNAHYGASKMRWLLDHHPAVQTAAQQQRLVFLPLAAYVTYLLTGTLPCVIDAVSASRTLLVAFAQQQWSDALLGLFGIDRSMLPAIVPTRYAFGHITLAGQTLPLQVVGGDQSLLPFAYGATALSHSLFMNAGTGAFVQTPLSPDQSPSALLCSVASIDDAQSLTVAEGTVNACAAALDWLWQQEQQQLTREEIESALQHISLPPVFHHRITALGSPYWLPADSSSFSAPASLAEKAVAVIESVVFLLAINIDLLLQAKAELQQILASGGSAQSDGFCQKLANVTGLPVIRHQDAEASARGAAFYLAGVHDYRPTSPPARFDPQDDRTLLARYQCFYETLRQAWLG